MWPLDQRMPYGPRRSAGQQRDRPPHPEGARAHQSAGRNQRARDRHRRDLADARRYRRLVRRAPRCRPATRQNLRRRHRCRHRRRNRTKSRGLRGPGDHQRRRPLAFDGWSFCLARKRRRRRFTHRIGESRPCAGQHHPPQRRRHGPLARRRTGGRALAGGSGFEASGNPRPQEHLSAHAPAHPRGPAHGGTTLVCRRRAIRREPGVQGSEAGDGTNYRPCRPRQAGRPVERGVGDVVVVRTTRCGCPCAYLRRTRRCEGRSHQRHRRPRTLSWHGRCARHQGRLRRGLARALRPGQRHQRQRHRRDLVELGGRSSLWCTARLGWKHRRGRHRRLRRARHLPTGRPRLCEGRRALAPPWGTLGAQA